MEIEDDDLLAPVVPQKEADLSSIIVTEEGVKSFVEDMLRSTKSVLSRLNSNHQSYKSILLSVKRYEYILKKFE